MPHHDPADTQDDTITELNAELVFMAQAWKDEVALLCQRIAELERQVTESTSLIQDRDTWRQAAMRYEHEATTLLQRCTELEGRCVRETSRVMLLSQEILQLRGR
jgi:hypothetical protein